MASIATVVASIVAVLTFVGGLLYGMWTIWRWMFSRNAPIYFGIPHLERVVRGREDDLTALRDGLLAKGETAIVNSGAVLQGQGGIGKTTLARQYVEDFRDQYDGIFWAVAETEGALAQALTGLAPQLEVTLDNLSPMQAAQAVLTKMAQDEREWLVIYDNVTEFATIRDLIPEGHLIVTTRSSAGCDGFATLQADVLGFETEDAPAVQVLMEAAERKDDAARARELAEALGGLPLALVVAGALIRSEGFGFAEYQTRIADVISQVPKNAAYPDSVIGAVKLSYDQLSEDAQIVADILAWWAPEGLTPDLLAGALEGENWEDSKLLLSDEVMALVSDGGRVSQAFQVLVDASLLTRDWTADGPHSLHRMTAAALREMQSMADAGAWAAALLAAVYPSDSNVSENFPICRKLTSHLQALVKTGRAPRGAAMDWLFNQSSVFLGAVGDYEGALALAEAGFAIISERFPEEDAGFLIRLHNLAMARSKAGDPDGAVQNMRRVVALKEAHHPDSEALAASLDQLGYVLVEQARMGQTARLPEAVKAYQRVLALRRRLLGRQSEPVAQTLNNLAAARGFQGRVAAAMRLFEASQKIRRAALSKGDARLAYGVLNTGAMWFKSGRADLAEDLLWEALQIQREAFIEEPDHPELRTSVGWLISCLLVRAQAGENRDKRERQAKQLAEEFGFGWEACLATVRKYPYAPEGSGEG